MKQEQEIPALPASLSIHFREDLIAHIKNLPGEPFERQVIQCSMAVPLRLSQ